MPNQHLDAAVYVPCMAAFFAWLKLPCGVNCMPPPPSCRLLSRNGMTAMELILGFVYEPSMSAYRHICAKYDAGDIVYPCHQPLSSILRETWTWPQSVV